MQTHELHAALVHAPLVLIPAASLTDLAAIGDSGPIRGRLHGLIGQRVWSFAAVSAVLAGVAGMAASQQVRAEKHGKNMMWLHGTGAVVLTAGTFAMAWWRRHHAPTTLQALLGLSATGLGLYAGYLGGEMVYGHGMGVKGMPASEGYGARDNPSVFSPSAPWVLLRDAVRGAGWLVSRARETLGEPSSLAHAAVG